MTFFSSTIDVLQTLVIALGGGLGVWGGINLLEGCRNDSHRPRSVHGQQALFGYEPFFCLLIAYGRDSRAGLEQRPHLR